jgi:hypothetical protein
MYCYSVWGWDLVSHSQRRTGIATGSGLNDRNSIPDRDKRVFSTPQRSDRLWGTRRLLSTGGKPTGVKNGGAIPPLPRMLSWHREDNIWEQSVEEVIRVYGPQNNSIIEKTNLVACLTIRSLHFILQRYLTRVTWPSDVAHTEETRKPMAGGSQSVGRATLGDASGFLERWGVCMKTNYFKRNIEKHF